MSKITISEIPFNQTWDIRRTVMWPGKSLDYVKLPNDENGNHYGLFAEGKLVSIVSAFIQNNEAQFRKFATLAEEQGKGYGSRLLDHLFKILTEQGVNRIWCNARVNKIHYYQRFGMAETDSHFTKGGISYVIMEKII